MKNNPTEKLLDILNDIKDKSKLDTYINSSISGKDSLKLSEYILEVSERRGFNKSDIIKNSDIYRTYGYELLNGKKSPSRDKLIQICIGNKFTLEETNRSLTLGKLGILYAKDSRDSIIIYALNNNISLIDVNFILHDHGLEPLVWF